MSSTFFWFWLPAPSPWKSEHVSQSCLTLCNPKDCSSSVHGILQARILEWIAIPFFRESSWLRDQTQVSLIAGRFFTIWATRKPTFSTRILSGRGGFLACLRTVSTFPPLLLSPHPSVPRDLTGLSSYNPCYPLSKLICCLMKKWWSMASPTSRILKASSMSTHPGRAKEGPKRPRHLSPTLSSSLTAPPLRKGPNKASLWGMRDMMGVNVRGQWNFILEMQTPPWGIQGQALSKAHLAKTKEEIENGGHLGCFLHDPELPAWCGACCPRAGNLILSLGKHHPPVPSTSLCLLS